MKTFNKPDLNAPRFRPKWKQVISKSLFEKFKLQFPEHADIDYALFKNIIKEYNSQLVQGVIDNRGGVELPEKLGALFIANCTWGSNENIENIDFGESRRLGIVVTHKNWESDHKLMKIFYSNFENRFRISNKKIWQFKFSKPNRKTISDAYKKSPSKYVTIDDKKKVSGIFKDRLREHGLGHTQIKVPTEYNEFNID